jgi:hypothetical protein
VRRRRKREGGAAEHVRSSAHYRTQGCFAANAFSHLQKACGKVGARQGVFWAQCKRVAKGVGSSGVFSIKEQGSTELCQNIRTSRRSVARDRQDRASFCAFIVLEQQAPKIDLQVDALRRQCEPILYSVDGFVEMSGFGKLACEFLKSGQIRWTPRSGTAQLLDAICRATRTAQRSAKQGFDFRVAAAAHRPLEWHDRITRTLLSDQGMSQDEDGAPIRAVRFQNFGCKLLRPTVLLHPQRQ